MDWSQHSTCPDLGGGFLKSCSEDGMSVLGTEGGMALVWQRGGRGMFWAKGRVCVSIQRRERVDCIKIEAGCKVGDAGRPLSL